MEEQIKAPMDKLRRFCEQFDDPVILSVESEGQRETLSELLALVKILPKLISRLEDAAERGTYLIIGTSKRGFGNAFK